MALASLGKYDQIQAKRPVERLVERPVKRPLSEPPGYSFLTARGMWLVAVS